MKRKQRQMAVAAPVASPAPHRQQVISPFPVPQMALGNMCLPNATSYATVMGNGMPMNLPQYHSVDEYGRIFCPIMTYAPQPNSAPVPVAIPNQIVQVAPIVTPVALVPYATQNQGLYQFEEQDD